MVSLRHRAGELGLGSAEDRLLTIPPLKGEISLAGVFPFAGVGGASCRRVIVVVVAVVAVVVVVEAFSI